MNTQNNKRSRASTERITEAFLGFLKKKDLSQIKVSDICKTAEINRSTFYARYADIYDLSDKIRENLEEDVKRLLGQEVIQSCDKSDFLQLFMHIRDNRDRYMCYFKLCYTERDFNFYDLCCPDSEFIDIDNIAYHITFFKSGFNAIVKQWLDNNCKESPQEMCDILLREYRGRFKAD